MTIGDQDRGRVLDVRSGDLLRVHRHNIRSLGSIAAAIVFAAASTL